MTSFRAYISSREKAFNSQHGCQDVHSLHFVSNSCEIQLLMLPLPISNKINSHYARDIKQGNLLIFFLHSPLLLLLVHVTHSLEVKQDSQDVVNNNNSTSQAKLK